MALAQWRCTTSPTAVTPRRRWRPASTASLPWPAAPAAIPVRSIPSRGSTRCADSGRALPPPDRPIQGGQGEPGAGRRVSAPKIRIDRLGKTFGEDAAQVRALQDFTLTVNDGEFVCLVGPSGCGKTTALRIVAGLEKPCSGTVVIARSSDSQRHPYGLGLEETGLQPW